ncbi:hypothetical protein EVAR_63156_1 [Eumeta japonica]|uniref:SWIM-type domain-containing protein n=1 Tax=Eumeta variegata TaxID=151549 RepID=A0A4C1Z464_EUMVA|nr:hypothetical protein EVAR_63156_1 [Eumeta japonica]
MEPAGENVRDCSERPWRWERAQVSAPEEAVKSIECHDCVASQGGCKHAIAFLMWIHRRSEEPSCTSVECYWMKSKLSGLEVL